MKTKHTPGPWTIDEHAQIIAGKSVLGRVYCGDVFPNPDLPECDANARLIAAAPELLECLETILESFYHEDGSCIIKNKSIVHESMKLLVRKAKPE